METKVITNTSRKATIWSTGFAMFAMFFGAGNIVFPLALGQVSQDQNLFAVLGMMITAVLVPLMGLFAMMLYDGDYHAFFSRIGKWPSFIVILIILAVIGPFGGIPRCITISYSTLITFGLAKVPFCNLFTFSLLSAGAIFLFTFRPNKILPLMGYVLTPLLLVSLAIIAFKGLFVMPGAEHSLSTAAKSFGTGFLSGYNTMDLLACFFFSSVVLLCLKRSKAGAVHETKSLINIAIWSSLVAATLLSLVYVSFSFLAAGYSAELKGVPPQELLGALAYLHLGPYAGLIAGAVVAFACLTTEIALAAILAEYVRKTLCKEKISYGWALALIVGLSFLVSTLEFQGISSMLSPFLQICYPALIVLTVLNIAHKLYNFKHVKSIFYGTCLVSLILYFLA